MNMKKIQNFVTQPQITSTYAGEAGPYIAAALLSAKTLDNKLITIHPNVKYREVLQKVALSGIVQDASCEFVTSGSVTLTERILEPKELQVNLSLCKDQFIESWNALQLGYSAFDTVPATFNDYLVSYTGQFVGQATEQSIWAGTDTNGSFVGFQTLLSASAVLGTGTDVLPARTGSVIDSGSITSANVINKLNNVYNTIPAAVYGKEDLVIYVGNQVGKAYQTALSGVTTVGSFNNQLNVGEKPSNFQGIEIVVCPGMSDNKIVAAQKSNLFFGTGLLSDYNTVRVIDQAAITGDLTYRVVMRFTAGVQFGIGQDIVYYGAY
jgi:hypothetical protein